MTSKPLLTIAIPTFNRASILDKSLSILIPQLIPFSDKVELIISDNCSTDNTQSIISKYQQKKGNIRFVSYLQNENTGYFGNFKLCKQLSTGDFFWLLSDNEHLTNSAISVLINIIEVQKECSAFYLDSFSITQSCNQSNTFNLQFADDFFNTESAYSSTLISSVIFRNHHDHDELLFSRFNNNLFLGFLLLCNVLSNKDIICTLRYSFFCSYPTKVSFDVFKAWSADIMQCVDFMVERGLLNEMTKEIFKTGYIRTNLFGHVVLFRKGKAAGFISNNLNELRIILDKYYLTNVAYRKHVYPILHTSNLGFKFFLLRRKIARPFNRFFSKN